MYICFDISDHISYPARFLVIVTITPTAFLILTKRVYITDYAVIGLPSSNNSDPELNFIFIFDNVILRTNGHMEAILV